VEDHKSKESLLGAPLQPGCQSHYVRTDMNGYVVKVPDPASYDEIVLAQENLVCPVLVLEIDVSNVLKLKIKLDEAMKKLQESERPPTDLVSSRKNQPTTDLVSSRKTVRAQSTAQPSTDTSEVESLLGAIELEEVDKDDSYVDWDG